MDQVRDREKPRLTVNSPITGAMECFDPRRAVEFVQKSMSEETQRAYSRLAREFFAAIGN